MLPRLDSSRCRSRGWTKDAQRSVAWPQHAFRVLPTAKLNEQGQTPWFSRLAWGRNGEKVRSHEAAQNERGALKRYSLQGEGSGCMGDHQQAARHECVPRADAR